MEWEYKVETLDYFQAAGGDMSIEEQLNKRGTEGWEFVSLLKANPATVGKPPRLSSDSMVFKREK